MTILDDSTPIIFCTAIILVSIVVFIALVRSTKKTALHLNGLDDQKIEMSFRLWSWRPIFQINGDFFPHTSNENKIILKRNDGNDAIITWKPKALGWDAPQFFLNGHEVQWVEPLKRHEFLWCAGIPIMVSFLNPAGFFVFPLGFLINTRIFRTQENIIAKYILTGITSFIVTLLPIICIGIAILAIR